jgi:glycosyltransferase involved in cell wall biosynthesis
VERPCTLGRMGPGKMSRAERLRRPTRRALLANRLALRLAQRFLRRPPSPPGERPAVTILLMNAYVMTGVTRSVLNLAAHLTDRCDVELVSVLRDRNKPFFPFPAGVRVSTIDDRREQAAVAGWRGRVQNRLRRHRSRLLFPVDMAAPNVTLWTDLRLVRRLRRLRAGILITTRPSLNMLGARAARPGLAVVAQEHRDLTRRGPRVHTSMRRLYPGLDALAVLTDTDRRRYQDLLQRGPRVVTIPNAVPELPGGRSALTEPRVLAVGRLTPQKGFDLLIPAFAEVARGEPDWSLRICGSGRLRDRLSQIAADRGVSERIELLGRVGTRKIAEQMEQASIFVLSSRSEGFPLVLLEAMSKGLPVVSYDCPTGPADIVDHGGNGLLVPPQDVDALGDAILELMRDAPKRRRFGAAAIERAAEYSADRVGGRWDDLLAELLSASSLDGSGSRSVTPQIAASRVSR